VEWRKHQELFDRPLHVVVDERRADEAAASVDDAMADCVCLDEVVDRAGFVSVDEVKLEARGTGIDHQDIHRRGFS
jgi:hypothetical protein